MTRLSIKWRLSLVSMATLTGIMLLFTVFVYVTLSKWMIQQQEESALVDAQHIAMAYPGNVETGSGNLNDAHPNWLNQFVSNSQSAFLISHNGHLMGIGGSGNSLVARSIPYGKLRDSVSILGIQQHHYVRVITASRSDSGTVLAWVVLYSSIDVVEGYIATLVRVLIIGSLGGIVLAGVSGYMLGFSALRPVARIIRAVRRMNLNRMDERLPDSQGKDEIAELTRTFNEMLERIGHAIQKQNEFVADASHEFRSPLTVIEGYANLLDRWGKQDPSVTERSIKAIKREAGRLRKLTNGLLQLAGIPYSQTLMTPHLVCPVIEEVVLQLSDVYQRPIEFVVEDTTLQAFIQPEHLHQVITILLQNAVKHTEFDKSITVRVYRERQTVRIDVVDEGAGIPAESLSHIFERFYRADKARSRATEGFGLGLAIARELVLLYQGSMWATSQLHMGTIMSVSLICF